jgi:NADH:ubiquinone oxidoreductase 24 kD subunit
MGGIKMIIEVCVGSACHLKGAYNVINEFMRIIKEKELDDKITIKAAFCLGNCTNGVSVRIDESEVLSCSADNVEEFFQNNIYGRL